WPERASGKSVRSCCNLSNASRRPIPIRRASNSLVSPGIMSRASNAEQYYWPKPTSQRLINSPQSILHFLLEIQPVNKLISCLLASTVFISRIERGVESPSLDNLVKIARALGVRVRDLVDGF